MNTEGCNIRVLIDTILTVLVTKYTQSITKSITNNMDKFLQDLGVKHKYIREHVKSMIYYLTTIGFVVYTTGNVHKVQDFIHKSIRYFSGGPNHYIGKLDIVFDLAILFLIGSCYYLFYTIGNKGIKYRIESIDKVLHKTIQRFIRILLMLGLIAIGLVLLQNTTLEKLYFKYINIGVAGLGIITASIMYIGYYYKLYDYVSNYRYKRMYKKNKNKSKKQKFMRVINKIKSSKQDLKKVGLKLLEYERPYSNSFFKDKKQENN